MEVFESQWEVVLPDGYFLTNTCFTEIGPAHDGSGDKQNRTWMLFSHDEKPSLFLIFEESQYRDGEEYHWVSFVIDKSPEIEVKEKDYEIL